jgi:FkbM family methyltransferase
LIFGILDHLVRIGDAVMLKKWGRSIYNMIYSSLAGHRIGELYPVKLIDRFMRARVRSDFTEIDGIKMFLDSRDVFNLSVRHIYEPTETGLVKRKVKPGDFVIDIGANIGYYTLILAGLVGEKGRVLTFEPEPNNFTLLKKNVEINHFSNVALMQKAVSNETGKIKLYLNPSNIVDHRIYDSHDKRLTADAEAVRLDDYFQDYTGRVDFIKMDIQGAEGKAIQGMQNLLKRNEKIELVMEFSPIALKTSGIEAEECLELLAGCGFNTFFDISEQKKTIKPVSFPELLNKYTPGKRNMTNIWCRKEG